MAAVNTCFIGVGCNRTPSATCWGNNGLIAYGACRGIAIYSPMVGSSCGGHVDSIWVSHTDRVNSVQWIPCDDKETEAVSASADSTAVVWRLRDNEMKPIATLSGHTASVTKAVGMYVRATDKEEPATLVATTSADSTVKLWRRESNEDYFTCVQTISVGSGFALDIAWAKLPSSGIPLLACGCDDQKIHLYAEQESQFVKVQTLIGHEDWLRGLEFTEDDNGDLLLASCGQDCFIRLWRIRVGSEQQSTLVDENTTTSGQQPHLVDDIKVKEISFSVGIEGGSKMYDVLLESILMAHDNWIYGVHWQPAVYTDEGKRHQPMCLLSASMDKTMIIWRPDPATGVWIDQVRVGEVGGNTLGLYGSQFSPDGKSILAHGYQGAFHLWHFEQETNNWSPEVTVSGHFNAVQDIAWDPNGEFLLSASTDQTMRLYAPWRRDNQKVTWHEIARPQIHGYDLQCLAMIGRFKFASGADEKVIRIFEAPKNFIKNFGQISSVDVTDDLSKAEKLPEGASVPPLGLSNKAVFKEVQVVPPENTGDDQSNTDKELQPHPNEQFSESYFRPVQLNAPPTEEVLLQNTLWPETQKLYGHGYEIFAVACNPQGTVLASACKAAKSDHASIILWDTSSWRQIGQLPSHALTVTQLTFSQSGKFLLSVSRDRTWSLFKETDSLESTAGLRFTKVAGTDKKTSVHSRIIWSCAWCRDDSYFVTSSRDKKVIIWAENNKEVPAGCPGNWQPVAVKELSDSVTAVAVYGASLTDGSYLLALGLDCGKILLLTWNTSETTEPWRVIAELDQHHAHHMTVKRLQFRRPNEGQEPEVKVVQLASCGADHLVRIYDIKVERS